MRRIERGESEIGLVPQVGDHIRDDVELGAVCPICLLLVHPSSLYIVAVIGQLHDAPRDHDIQDTGTDLVNGAS